MSLKQYFLLLIIVYICDKDAQLVVDKMNMRKDELPNYTFEYKCVDNVLNTMFWADETDKLYYKEFGDVISFDATFRTNKYALILITHFFLFKYEY